MERGASNTTAASDTPCAACTSQRNRSTNASHTLTSLLPLAAALTPSLTSATKTSTSWPPTGTLNAAEQPLRSASTASPADAVTVVIVIASQVRSTSWG